MPNISRYTKEVVSKFKNNMYSIDSRRIKLLRQYE